MVSKKSKNKGDWQGQKTRDYLVPLSGVVLSPASFAGTEANEKTSRPQTLADLGPPEQIKPICIKTHI